MSLSSADRAQMLVRPTLATQFHIDFEWWERADRDWAVLLRSHLCPEHQVTLGELEADALVDHVDPETAEVSRVPGLQHTLMTHCAVQPDYITPQGSLVDVVFRVFMANGNAPLSCQELGNRLGRPAETILRTLTGPRVYRGIRPAPGTSIPS
jgi:hypothetical protein